MLAQHPADLAEIDLSFADLQPFAIQSLGVTEMQVGGVRAEPRETFREVEAEMIGSELRVRDVHAHAQTMGGAEGRGLLWEDEDVLVTLAAEMPGERRHGLRRQLHALHVEFGQTLGEDAIGSAFSSGGSGASMVKPPILATIGGRMVLGKNFLRPRVMSITACVCSSE